MNTSSSPTSRRTFLQTATGAPVMALASGGLAAAPVWPRSNGTLRRSDFESCRGKVFVFESESGGPGVQARLEKVEALPGTHHADLSFSLLFAPQAGATLSQGTWRFSTAAGPTGLMFVSPNDAQGRVVEAVFNRG